MQKLTLNDLVTCPWCGEENEDKAVHWLVPDLAGELSSSKPNYNPCDHCENWIWLRYIDSNNVLVSKDRRNVMKDLDDGDLYDD